jgi:Transposase IS4
MFYRWKDKKDVLMLSSATVHEMVQAKKTKSKDPKIVKKAPPSKPLTILRYNEHMGAVDHADKVTKPYVTERKTIKWYKKVYFHLTLNDTIMRFIM